jgi:hypothetical protein
MFFLETRCKILEIAAALDRLDRGAGSVADDPRMARIRQALQTLMRAEDGRAEEVQRIFSLPYDPAWPKPQPK